MGLSVSSFLNYMKEKSKFDNEISELKRQLKKSNLNEDSYLFERITSLERKKRNIFKRQSDLVLKYSSRDDSNVKIEIENIEREKKAIKRECEDISLQIEKLRHENFKGDTPIKSTSPLKITVISVGTVSLVIFGVIFYISGNKSSKIVDKPTVSIQETTTNEPQVINNEVTNKDKDNDFIINLTAYNDYKGILKLQDIDKNGDIIKQLEDKLSTMNRDDIENVEIVDVMHAIDIGDGPLPGNNDKYAVCNDCFDLNPHKQAKILNEVKDNYAYLIDCYIHYKDKPNNPVIYSTYFDKDKLSLVFSFTQSTEISYLNRMKNKFGLPVTGPIQGDDTIILESTEDIK